MTITFGGMIPAVVNIPVAPYAAIAPPTAVNTRRNRAYPSFATLTWSSIGLKIEIASVASSTHSVPPNS